MVSPTPTGPVGSFSLMIDSSGPIRVSTSLLSIGSRSGAVGSRTAALVTTVPPAAVTVTVNENSLNPGWMTAAAQVTVLPFSVQAGEQLPIPSNEVPAG